MKIENQQTTGCGHRATARVAGVVALALLVVGCAVNQKSEVRSQKPEGPPLPQHVAPPTRTTAVAVVPPVASVTYGFDYAPGATIAIVEASNNLVQWRQLLRLTNATTFTVQPTNAQDYFRVTHPAYERRHWWDPNTGRYRQ